MLVAASTRCPGTGGCHDLWTRRNLGRDEPGVERPDPTPHVESAGRFADRASIERTGTATRAIRQAVSHPRGPLAPAPPPGSRDLANGHRSAPVTAGPVLVHRPACQTEEPHRSAFGRAGIWMMGASPAGGAPGRAVRHALQFRPGEMLPIFGDTAAALTVDDDEQLAAVLARLLRGTLVPCRAVPCCVGRWTSISSLG